METHIEIKPEPHPVPSIHKASPMLIALVGTLVVLALLDSPMILRRYHSLRLHSEDTRKASKTSLVLFGAACLLALYVAINR